MLSVTLYTASVLVLDPLPDVELMFMCICNIPINCSFPDERDILYFSKIEFKGVGGGGIFIYLANILQDNRLYNYYPKFSIIEFLETMKDKYFTLNINGFLYYSFPRRHRHSKA